MSIYSEDYRNILKTRPMDLKSLKKDPMKQFSLWFDEIAFL